MALGESVKILAFAAPSAEIETWKLGAAPKLGVAVVVAAEGDAAGVLTVRAAET